MQLIGEEFYAASAYLSGSPEMIGSVKGQDYVKLICMIFIFLVISFSILGFLKISPFTEPDFLNPIFRMNKI